MKRHALLLTAALGMAAAQTPALPAGPGTPAATSAAPTDPQLSGRTVSLNTGNFRGPLSVLLVSVAKAAGYEVVFDMNVDALPLVLGAPGTVGTAAAPSGTGAAPGYDGNLAAKPLAYNLVNRPFNQVWPLLMDVYGLSYTIVQLGPGQVLRVGNSPVQRNLKLPAGLRATDIEPRLKIFFGSRKMEPIKAEGSGVAVTTGVLSSEITLDSPTLRIVAEPSSNSIIVRGTSAEVLEVERLFREIVSAQTPSQNVPVVQRIYRARAAAGGLRGALLDQFPTLRVTPVAGSDQLILAGTQAQIDEALALLAQIDPAATAAAAAQPEAPTVQRVYAVKGQQADIVTLLAAQFAALKVTPVGQTGQLVITGPQPQLDAALALLGQVDRPAPAPQAGPQTVQRVFQLVNASAEEVKATLEGTLAREVTPEKPLANVPVNATDANGNAITVTVPTTGTSAAQAPQEAPAAAPAASANAATIIADKRTNTLIVRGSAPQVAQIAELVPQLDQVVPQINVQVRIQEINETAARTLGMDWKVNFGGFNVSLGGGGLGAAFDPTRSLVGFNVFPTLQALENQGFTKRVYDGNITMQSGQRSLGTGTNSQNASAGAAASIKSGGRLEINIPSSAGNIEKQIDYGLNLDFFEPQVAPDGTVTLRVRGQVNNIAGALPTTALPNLLNFTNSEAQSTITFKSGQTVLMSGLLGTSETKSNDGVPFLRSLPLIGPAFSKQSTNRSQTQLLVIITGNVVK